MFNLLGLLSLMTCTHEETGPSIDLVVGQYDSTLECVGEFNYQLTPRMFTITKSGKANNLLTIRIEINQSRNEIWEVQYFAEGRLVMDNQVVQGSLENPKEYQEALGRVTADSVILEGRRSFTYILATKATYCSYRAKKKR